MLYLSMTRGGHPMAPRTIEFTSEQLVARRERILRTLDTTLDELRAREAAGALSGEEWDAIADLEEIGFLLGSNA